MNTYGKIAFGLLLFTLIVVVGAIILSVDETNANAKAECQYIAELFQTEERINKGLCYLRTKTGIWLPKDDFLLIVASDCR